MRDKYVNTQLSKTGNWENKILYKMLTWTVYFVPSCQWGIVSSEVPWFDTYNYQLMSATLSYCKMLPGKKPLRIKRDESRRGSSPPLLYLWYHWTSRTYIFSDSVSLNSLADCDRSKHWVSMYHKHNRMWIWWWFIAVWNKLAFPSLVWAEDTRNTS